MSEGTCIVFVTGLDGQKPCGKEVGNWMHTEKPSREHIDKQMGNCMHHTFVSAPTVGRSGGPQDISMADIDSRFRSHMMGPVAVIQAGTVRSAVVNLAAGAFFSLPAGRDKSLAYAHLEDALMHAIAAIARQKGNN